MSDVPRPRVGDKTSTRPSRAGRGQGALYGDEDFGKFLRTAFRFGSGLTRHALDRPVIAIADTYSEFNPCHRGVPELVQSVKRGVMLAGGLPLSFPTISLGEPFTAPTSMLYRNLMAIDTEAMLNALPMDAAVLIGGCDKTIPAQLMAAASADVPAVIVPVGPMLPGNFRGAELGACTDCRRLWQMHRAGDLSASELVEVGEALVPTHGTCGVMGTASTMACAAEALGMTLPGGASIPAVYAERLRLAEASGRRAVALAREGLRPSAILTEGAFDNAVRVVCAAGGSTNAVIHLIAIARRAGVALTLERFDGIARATPLLVDVKPGGNHTMLDFHLAGGVPALLRELRRNLDLDARTVGGPRLRAVVHRQAETRSERGAVIRPLDDPIRADAGLAVLWGNLAPNGAVIKSHAASPHLLSHSGRAVVFGSLDELEARIDHPALPVDGNSVLVLSGVGPVGGPGMPEVGQIPIPKKLLTRGIRDLVRVSDARMSGTAFGTVVLHVAPEAAVGGPLAAVIDGDIITLDVERREINVEVTVEELGRRLEARSPDREHPEPGFLRLHRQHVLQANEGCDFDLWPAPGR